jgi:hypothetical protein
VLSRILLRPQSRSFFEKVPHLIALKRAQLLRVLLSDFCSHQFLTICRHGEATSDRPASSKARRKRRRCQPLELSVDKSNEDNISPDSGDLTSSEGEIIVIEDSDASMKNIDLNKILVWKDGSGSHLRPSYN